MISSDIEGMAQAPQRARRQLKALLLDRAQDLLDGFRQGKTLTVFGECLKRLELIGDGQMVEEDDLMLVVEHLVAGQGPPLITA